VKEPYERDDILHKRPIIPRSLLIVTTPYNELLSVYAETRRPREYRSLLHGCRSLLHECLTSSCVCMPRQEDIDNVGLFCMNVGLFCMNV